MADPVTTPPAPVPAPTPAPAPEPAAASPQTAAPPTGSEPSKGTTTPPAVSPPTAPVVEAKPAEPSPAVEPAAAVPTLLEDFDKQKAEAEAAKAKPTQPAAAEAKPVEPAKAEKPPEATTPAQSPPAAAAPVEYKYTLPETMKMDDALKGRVHKAFDDFRANPAEGAQQLVDLHNEQLQTFERYLNDRQQQNFRDMRQEWARQTRSDQELGGSGHQTAMGAVARMRDLLVPEQHRPAFEQFLRVTGAGDHPEFLRIFHQAARLYDEPSVPSVNPRPPPNNGQRPSRRLRDIYDHPRSSADGRS